MGSVACLEAGKHVLREKPLTLKLDETKAIIDASERTRRIVQVGTQSRHVPGYVVLAEKLREGLIGEVLYGWAQTFRSDWRKLYPDPKEDSRRNWRMKQSEGGSVVFEMGVHTIDALYGNKSSLQIPERSAREAIVFQRPYWRPFGEGSGKVKQTTIELPPAGADPSFLQYGHFLEAVQGKKPPFPSARDHLPAVLIARASELSQAEHRHIRASEVT